MKLPARLTTAIWDTSAPLICAGSRQIARDVTAREMSDRDWPGQCGSAECSQLSGVVQSQRLETVEEGRSILGTIMVATMGPPPACQVPLTLVRRRPDSGW